MRRLIDRKVWTGPLSVGRIALLISAVWLITTGVLVLVGVPGWTNAKFALPASVMMLALGFVGGYQLGQNKRS